MQNLTVISSGVRLSRNYTDFPFDLSSRPDDAQALITRTVSALDSAGLKDAFDLIRLCECSEQQRKLLLEEGVITENLLRSPDTGAVLLDRKRGLSIVMNEDDHLRMQAVEPSETLQKAADEVFRLDDAFSREVTFAFDNELGYLTACPTSTGTGMRASLQLHLPLLTYFKQMGAVGETVGRVGLTIRGLYGEGSEALGCIYQISNQTTLGRTEEEIIRTISAVGRQLAEKEEGMRERAREEDPTLVEDRVFRAYALLQQARIMDMTEFYGLWSSVRMGMLMGLVPDRLTTMDQMLETVQDGHLMAYFEKRMEGKELNAARAQRIRDLLSGEA